MNVVLFTDFFLFINTEASYIYVVVVTQC